MNVEIIEPPEHTKGRPTPGTTARVAGGIFLATATTLTALSIGLLLVFGTTLAVAAVVTLLWPLLFTPQFTAWVFGTEKLEFWKAFVILLAGRTAVRLMRRQPWQRK